MRHALAPAKPSADLISACLVRRHELLSLPSYLSCHPSSQQHCEQPGTARMRGRTPRRYGGRPCCSRPGSPSSGNQPPPRASLKAVQCSKHATKPAYLSTWMLTPVRNHNLARDPSLCSNADEGRPGTLSAARSTSRLSARPREAQRAFVERSHSPPSASHPASEPQDGGQDRAGQDRWRGEVRETR
jgi:hypothetical protein